MGCPLPRHLNHPRQQTMGKQLPVSCAGQRLALKPVTHAVTLRADLPRRAPERLFRGFIKLPGIPVLGKARITFPHSSCFTPCVVVKWRVEVFIRRRSPSRSSRPSWPPIPAFWSVLDEPSTSGTSIPPRYRKIATHAVQRTLERQTLPGLRPQAPAPVHTALPSSVASQPAPVKANQFPDQTQSRTDPA